jgi:hypothetical protein
VGGNRIGHRRDDAFERLIVRDQLQDLLAVLLELGREVLRMRKQNAERVPQPLMETERTLRGLSLEVRRALTQS